VAKEKSEICYISFTFPITVADENFNLAGALESLNYTWICPANRGMKEFFF
jgi:hypothetical protein